MLTITIVPESRSHPQERECTDALLDNHGDLRSQPHALTGKMSGSWRNAPALPRDAYHSARRVRATGQIQNRFVKACQFDDDELQMASSTRLIAASLMLSLAGCGNQDPDRQAEVADETGMMAEGQAEDIQGTDGRADLEVKASASDLVDGVANITASLEILDTPEILHPTISFNLGDGVEAVSLPTDCSQTASEIVCEFTGLVSRGEPIGTVLRVQVEESAKDPNVTVVVTSDSNPVPNDPNPTNNIVTIEF